MTDGDERAGGVREVSNQLEIGDLNAKMHQ